MADRRGRMVRVGEELKSAIRSADTGGGLARARASAIWPEVAGPEIARHTVGMGLRSGELVVHVDSHAWATQLGMLSEELRARINSALGQDTVRSIRFTVARTVGDARAERDAERDAGRRYGGDRVDPMPLSPEELEAIEEEASSIESDTLREAAIRARVRDLEVKKARSAKNARQKSSGSARGGN